jgi:hypothetical protein
MLGGLVIALTMMHGDVEYAESDTAGKECVNG